ncbi:MAG: argininosuccinate lyase [Bacteroidales bacterium]|nr:argininosuccinate lyase [Bacteroidales bacterium]
MKLWDKGYSINSIIEQFTVGNDRELDLKLAKYDVLGNIAHAKMLHSIHLLNDQELESILVALQEIQENIEAGSFQIEESFEDVHSKIEFELTAKIGDAGKKIHTARSRNDQVLVDLHLYAKAEILEIKLLIKTLFDTLITQSNAHKDVLIPGYTHFQLAMPSSFGLWFSAYAETLIDDLIFLNAAYKISNQNPLGSAAGYGTSFPIDRQMTTDLLGFQTMKYNVIAAQLSRGKLEKSVAFALSSIAGTLSKLASDSILFMNQNFGFFSFPKELTTGSSIMPHKQNPDVFELIRAKANKIQALPNEIILLTNNLTSGYHRDFQLLKSGFIGAIEEMKELLYMTSFMLERVIVSKNILDKKDYDFLFSVEEVNKLVMLGIPFREAYQKIGQAIELGNFRPERKVVHSHQGSIGNLSLKEIQQKFNSSFE